MKDLTTAILSAAALLMSAPAFAEFDYDRAQQNYMDLLSGKKQPHDLTPTELYDVRQFDAAVRAHPKPLPDTKANCREHNATSQPPSPLEDAVLDLKCSQRPE